MKRWMAFSILMLFVIGMLGYGIYFYRAEQLEKAKAPVRGEITVYTDLPNNLTTLLADKYLVEKNVKVTIMPLTEDKWSNVFPLSWQIPLAMWSLHLKII